MKLFSFAWAGACLVSALAEARQVWMITQHAIYSIMHLSAFAHPALPPHRRGVTLNPSTLPACHAGR